MPVTCPFMLLRLKSYKMQMSLRRWSGCLPAPVSPSAVMPLSSGSSPVRYHDGAVLHATCAPPRATTSARSEKSIAVRTMLQAISHSQDRHVNLTIYLWDSINAPLFFARGDANPETSQRMGQGKGREGKKRNIYGHSGAESKLPRETRKAFSRLQKPLTGMGSAERGPGCGILHDLKPW